MTCAEYRDWVAADVDGELGADAAELRAHVEACPVCLAERRRQAAVRSSLRGRSLRIEAPPELRARILAALDAEPGDELSAPRAARRRRMRPWLWTPLALAAAAVFALVLGYRGGRFEPVIRGYDLAARGELPLAIRTEALGELERFYRENRDGDGLPEHVVDLSAAGFRLVGGAIQPFPGRRARLSVYSDGEHTIVCDYQLARHFPFDLPAGGKPVFFRERGVSFCARRVGDEVCLLVTRMPLALLRAKLGAPEEG